MRDENHASRPPVAPVEAKEHRVSLLTPQAFATKDCQAAGCPDEATDGLVCDFHRRYPAEPIPAGGASLRLETGSYAHLMEDEEESKALPEISAATVNEQRTKYIHAARVEEDKILPAANGRTGHGVARWTQETVVAAIKAWAEKNGRPPAQRDATGDSSLPSGSIARTACGSWADAVEQAGFPRPKIGGDQRKGWETRRKNSSTTGAAAATIRKPSPATHVVSQSKPSLVELAGYLEHLDEEIVRLQRAREEIAASIRERLA